MVSILQIRLKLQASEPQRIACLEPSLRTPGFGLLPPTRLCSERDTGRGTGLPPHTLLLSKTEPPEHHPVPTAWWSNWGQDGSWVCGQPGLMPVSARNWLGEQKVWIQPGGG